MLSVKKAALGALTFAALASGIAAPYASAANGGDRHGENPGIIGLTDSEGNVLCSAVLMDPQWALTFDSPMTCAGSSFATADSHDPVAIDKQVTPDVGADKSQARLIHLAEPVKRVKPAQLDTKAPIKGEKLEIAAFNGNDGINKLLSVGRAPITVKNDNAWLTWFDQPEDMKLQTGIDSGAAILRDGKVAAFAGLVTAHEADAEDIENVNDWVQQTIHQDY